MCDSFPQDSIGGQSDGVEMAASYSRTQIAGIAYAALTWQKHSTSQGPS